MATIAATRSNPVIRTFYARLLAPGEARKLALVAASKKPLIILNPMIPTRTAWAPKPQLTP